MIRKIIHINTLLLVVGCGAPLQVVTDDLTDLPLAGLSAEWRDRFDQGDRAFELTFTPADGLGPLYIRQSCASCHTGGGRGPGFVEKMSLTPGADTSLDGSVFPHGHTVRRRTTAQSSPLLPPERADVRVSQRSGLAVWAVGAMEAVADETVLALEAAQASRGDGISGRANWVRTASLPNPDVRFHPPSTDAPRLGRFGAKARVATLDDFAADAFQGDMGLTTPLRPHEALNPDGLDDDAKPGVDVDLETLNAVADYLRTLRLPARVAPLQAGREAFSAAGCTSCHLPSLPTRADWPVAPLAGIDAPLFTDLLLHDMGATFADGLVEGLATASEFRTAPLVGLRFMPSFLHDGRATTVEEAVSLHGAADSEAHASVAAFEALPAPQRAALLEFVSSL